MRREYTILHLFCGAGGGGLGSAEARSELGSERARFRVLGGVDVDRQACTDFEALVGAPTLCADVAKVQPADIRRTFGETAPDVVLTSPPCKGFSALLPKAKAATEKYQRLNRLVLQGVHLVLSAWAECPRVIFLENVPRITSRGRNLLVQVRQLLAAHGYAWAEGNHDCGEVGGLGQHRRRYFLVARHQGRMGQVVYVPPRRRVRGCGEVLQALPVPGLGDGGPMHTLPRLSMLNLVRLAAIPAGGDWRDLPGVVPTGTPRRKVHRRHKVIEWDAAAPTIGGSGSNGAAAVADPRGFPGHMGVLDPAHPSGTVTAGAAVARGAFAVADGRRARTRTRTLAAPAQWPARDRRSRWHLASATDDPRVGRAPRIPDHRQRRAARVRWPVTHALAPSDWRRHPAAGRAGRVRATSRGAARIGHRDLSAATTEDLGAATPAWSRDRMKMEIVAATEVGQLVVGMLSNGAVVVAICCADDIRRSIRARVREVAMRSGDEVCSSCGWRPTLADRTVCGHCAEIQDRNQDGARCRARAMGLCITCKSRPSRDGIVRCISCADKFNAQQRERQRSLRSARRDAGVCTDCGGERDGETLMCAACRARARKIMRSHRANVRRRGDDYSKMKPRS